MAITFPSQTTLAKAYSRIFLAVELLLQRSFRADTALLGSICKPPPPTKATKQPTLSSSLV